MTWHSVGTHTFMPTDKAVQIGSFDLAAGQDTIWVRITQLNDPADWPFSYGILSWRNANGTPLGSLKAYSNRVGEVFRLGNGLPPSDGTGSIWFEPRGFNLAWLKAGFPWELQFEAQGGTSGGQVTSYWNRDPVNGVLSPVTAGDDVDLFTGDLYSGGAIQQSQSLANSAICHSINKQFTYSQGDNTYISFRANGSQIGHVSQNSVSSVVFSSSSDYRLKENVVPLAGSTDRLKQLKPCSFSWVGGQGKKVDGFLAHEAQAVVPEAVTGEKDAVDEKGNPAYQGIDQSKLVPLLTAALQESISRIEVLEGRLNALNP